MYQYIDYITLTPLVALNLPLHLVSPCGHVLLPTLKNQKNQKNQKLQKYLLLLCVSLYSVYVMIFSNPDDELSLHLL